MWTLHICPSCDHHIGFKFAAILVLTLLHLLHDLATADNLSDLSNTNKSTTITPAITNPLLNACFTSILGQTCSGHGQCFLHTCFCDDFWTGNACHLFLGKAKDNNGTQDPSLASPHPPIQSTTPTLPLTPALQSQDQQLTNSSSYKCGSPLYIYVGSYRHLAIFALLVYVVSLILSSISLVLLFNQYRQAKMSHSNNEDDDDDVEAPTFRFRFIAISTIVFVSFFCLLAYIFRLGAFAGPRNLFRYAYGLLQSLPLAAQLLLLAMITKDSCTLFYAADLNFFLNPFANLLAFVDLISIPIVIIAWPLLQYLTIGYLPFLAASIAALLLFLTFLHALSSACNVHFLGWSHMQTNLWTSQNIAAGAILSTLVYNAVILLITALQGLSDISTCTYVSHASWTLNYLVFVCSSIYLFAPFTFFPCLNIYDLDNQPTFKL